MTSGMSGLCWPSMDGSIETTMQWGDWDVVDESKVDQVVTELD